MRIHWTQTDTSNQLHIHADSPRDRSILDIFTNQRQGGTLTMTVNADGDVVVVSAEVKE